MKVEKDVVQTEVIRGVNITLSPEEAVDLATILNYSDRIWNPQPNTPPLKDLAHRCEYTSQTLWKALQKQGFITLK